MEKKWRLLLVMVVAMYMFFTGAVCAEPLEDFSEGDADLVCNEYTIPVRIAEEGFRSLFKHDVVGKLCWEGQLEGKTLQVLLSGGGYGPIYWDFPYQPETYSYVKAAASRGYATFNLSRIGIGDSAHPFGLFIDIDTNGLVVHQVIEYLTGTAGANIGTGKVMTVGHSMGSLMAISHAVHFPQDIQGIILTGFVHNVNPDYVTAVRDGSYIAFFDPRFFGRIWDFTYMTSKPGTRQDMFYVMEQADPEVVRIDEANKETLTLGEVISTGQYYDNSTLQIHVPVQIVLGDDDIVGCGGAFDCHDSAAVAANEERNFSPEACIETQVVETTGHVLNLHRNAQETYGLMLDWSDRRIGASLTSVPTEPCEP